MSNATWSNPWLIVLDLWGCWLLVVGFCKTLLPLVWVFYFLVMGFVNPLTLGVGPWFLVMGFVSFEL
jgi:hypothetical protein